MVDVMARSGSSMRSEGECDRVGDFLQQQSILGGLVDNVVIDFPR